MTTVYKHAHAKIETTYKISGSAGKIYNLKLETAIQYIELRGKAISIYNAETKKHCPG